MRKKSLKHELLSTESINSARFDSQDSLYSYSHIVKSMRNLDPKVRLFLILTFLVSACSIIYELLFSQLITILFGNTVVQYSITIGLFLFFLGVGSFSYSRIKSDFIDKLMFVEFAITIISVIGVFGLPYLYILSAKYFVFGKVIVLILGYVLVAVIGFLSGFEIPILTRLVEDVRKTSSFSHVLGVDYIGSLLGTVLYALFLYPELGVFGTVVVVSFVNLAIGLYLLYYSSYRKKFFALVLIFVLIIYGLLLFNIGTLNDSYTKFYRAEKIMAPYNYGIDGANYSVESYFSTVYQDVIEIEMQLNPKVFVEETIYDNRCIYIDSHAQVCRKTALPYHTGMVDIPLLFVNFTQKPQIDVLVIGGGDFIGIAHLLKYPQVRSIDHVDIDGEFVEVMKTNEFVRDFHNDAYLSPIVTTYIQDGFTYVLNTNKTYDVILLDLPELTSDKLLPLFSAEFASNLARILRDEGFVVSWMYPYIEGEPYSIQGEVLLSTYSFAGFNHVGEYYTISAYKNYQPGEFFVLFAHSKLFVNLENAIYSEYLSDVLSQTNYTQISWRNLKTDAEYIGKQRVNSVFRPNFNLLYRSSVLG
jgi:spermidine synthase